MTGPILQTQIQKAKLELNIKTDKTLWKVAKGRSLIFKVAKTFVLESRLIPDKTQNGNSYKVDEIKS